MDGKVLYNVLIEEGVDPKTISRILTRLGFKSPLIFSDIEVVSGEKSEEPASAEAVKPRGRHVQETSQRRVVAHSLLRIAYLANNPEINREHKPALFQVAYLHDEIARNFARYNIEPSIPAATSLQNLLSALRNGKVSHLPPIYSKGPLSYNVKGVKTDVIYLYPRDPHKDRSDGLINDIPDWVTEGI